MSWSKGYKKSIDCSNPKGFSQKAHCAGRKARQAGKDTKSKSVNEMKISELKEQIRTVLRERSVKAIQKDYSNVIADMEKHLELYKKSKGTPEEKKHIGHLKTLTQKKKSLQKELDLAVANLYKNAELKVEESVNEDIEPQTKKIASLTGTRADAVKHFVSANALNITKLLKFIEKGKLSDRMDFVTALAGKPGNPIQKKMIKMFSESVNEATEPEIISQLKDIVKNKQYQSVKDPKTGKKMKVDMQTANVVLQIYNGLSNVNKDNMVKMGLPKMIEVSWKIINKYKK